MQYFNSHGDQTSAALFHSLFDIDSYMFFLPFTVKVKADAKIHEYLILSSLPRKVKKQYLILFLFNYVLTIVNIFVFCVE